MNAKAVLSYLASRQWAMDPQELQAMAEAVIVSLEAAGPEAIEAAKLKAAQKVEGPLYEVKDGVAHISVSGPMVKEVPCAMFLAGISATKTSDVQAAVEAAALDESVKSIALNIDSPGGSIDGVKNLADAIHAARDLKPVEANVGGIAASAAYWLGSQASTINAGATSMIGSIGVYTVMRDSSQQYANDGVRVHVVRSHELKGAGIDGAPVTDAQLADTQRMVDEATAMFVNDVARGRGLSPETVRESATGQAWFASAARDRKLIDAVKVTHRVPTREARFSAAKVPQKETIVEEQQMAKRLAELEASLSDLQKMNASQAETINQLRAAARETLIAKYQASIAPAALEAAREYGEFCGSDLEKFERHLAAQKVVVNPTRVSEAGAVAETKQELSAEALAIAKMMGNSADDVRKYGIKN